MMPIIVLIRRTQPGQMLCGLMQLAVVFRAIHGLIYVCGKRQSLHQQEILILQGLFLCRF
ncbi:hypothetical protein AB182_20005 [Phytobacter ursingii]|uniref:Uncharacterized protein n=1 Tax=Phytobacter ursingii TaxID=1972431 RepID=A0AAC8QRS4_9ENTR|nr:hypothetical protein AB182_20005 [Phytobacter ursingii]